MRFTTFERAACLPGMLLFSKAADAVNGSSKGVSAETKRFEQFHRRSRGCSQSQRESEGCSLDMDMDLSCLPTLPDVVLWLRQGWTKKLLSGARVQYDLHEELSACYFDWPLQVQRSGCRFLAQLALFSFSIAKDCVG